eukprot:Pgem_evm1s17076
MFSKILSFTLILGTCGVPVPERICPDVCPDYLDFVCGSDGNTYNNPCTLRQFNCANKHQNAVSVVHAGACEDVSILPTLEDDDDDVDVSIQPVPDVSILPVPDGVSILPVRLRRDDVNILPILEDGDDDGDVSIQPVPDVSILPVPNGVTILPVRRRRDDVSILPILEDGDDDGDVSIQPVPDV